MFAASIFLITAAVGFVYAILMFVHKKEISPKPVFTASWLLLISIVLIFGLMLAEGAFEYVSLLLLGFSFVGTVFVAINSKGVVIKQALYVKYTSAALFALLVIQWFWTVYFLVY